MLLQAGVCPGIENYSRPLSGRAAGEPPDTLYSFFPDDFLLFVDESHVTVPQIRAMYRRRSEPKTTLVEHGFRLPSALDNRPLKFEEWEERGQPGRLRLGHPERLRTGEDAAAKWSSRLFGPPGCSIR